jgi:hypothetical protein
MSTTAAAIQRVSELYRQAADANRHTPGRVGNVVVISPASADDVLIAADLHGHRLNFRTLVQRADLAGHSRRHLILQEVCHGGPRYPPEGGCMSHLLLEDVAELKTAYPDRVHFLLSNHELAELTDFPISKGGMMLNLQFRIGMQTMYGKAALQIREAFHAFLHSCPLAVRIGTEILVCHGSPDRVAENGFDASVFDRPLTTADMQPGGPAFRLVWGRDFRASNADALARLVNAKLLVHGHEPCAEGYSTPNERQIILDCCGDRACYLLVPLQEQLTYAQVAARIQRL